MRPARYFSIIQLSNSRVTSNILKLLYVSYYNLSSPKKKYYFYNFPFFTCKSAGHLLK